MNAFLATDLVCRARQQPLTSDEQRRLNALLSTSTSARLAQALLAHLDRESEVQRGDDALIARVAALASGTQARKRRRKPNVVLLAAACVCISFGAFAGWQSQWPRHVARWATSKPEAALSQSTEQHPPQHPPQHPRARHMSANPNSLALGATSPSAMPGLQPIEPLASQETIDRLPPVAKADFERGRSDTTSARSSSATDDSEAAARVFANANLARREGRIGEAIVGYHKVIQQFPSVREATPSRLALAKLQSETAPSEALMHYQRLLQTPGPLRPEALFGTVQAARKVGRADIAQRAIDELLSSYPNSPYAEALRRRVEE